MSGVIGGAGDFYRLRVTRLDEGDVPDLDWRDDILYRRPESEPAHEYDVWRVEAVDVDDDETAAVLATFDTSEEAHGWMDAVTDDLLVMTRSEFENTYFSAEDTATGEAS